LKVLPILQINNAKANSKEQSQSVAFGYSFFMKGIPSIPCAYCARPTLSIPEVLNFAKTLDSRSGTYVLPIFEKFYDVLDNTHKVIIDILKAEIEAKPRVKVKEIIVNLAKKFEGITNQRYASALDNSLKKSQIKKGSVLYRLLDDIITESQEKLLTNPDNKSGQKVLRISVLQDGVIDLIHKIPNDEDKLKLKIFLKTVNSEFNLIKMDPSTFFAKFGQDSMNSFLASLFAPIRATADHIVTHSRKGLCDSSNYILTCGKCNWDRADKPFKDFISSKHDVLIPNIQSQFEHLDSRLLGPMCHYKKLTPQQFNEMFEYLSKVPKVIQDNAERSFNFNLPSTQQILATKVAEV